MKVEQLLLKLKELDGHLINELKKSNADLDNNEITVTQLAIEKIEELTEDLEENKSRLEQLKEENESISSDCESMFTEEEFDELKEELAKSSFESGFAASEQHLDPMRAFLNYKIEKGL